MDNKEFLHKLFDIHQSDLHSIFPEIRTKLFVCPICFCVFTETDIENDKLDNGHVWPTKIREGNKEANKHCVLICKSCNQKAGSRGDRHMQLKELAEKGNEKGEAIGELFLKSKNSKNNLNIKIQGLLKKEGEFEASISGKLENNNPNELKKLEYVSGKNEPLSLVIKRYPKFNPALAQTGWITSAYLYAFFSFGYRYIFHKSVLPVREFIFRSFDKSVNEKTELYKLDCCEVREYRDRIFIDPEIMIVIPSDEKTYVHLEINFRKTNISIPMHFVSGLLHQFVEENLSDVDKERMKSIKNNEFLYIPINSSKHTKKESFFDYLLGKPLPGSI